MLFAKGHSYLVAMTFYIRALHSEKALNIIINFPFLTLKRS